MILSKILKKLLIVIVLQIFQARFAPIFRNRILIFLIPPLATIGTNDTAKPGIFDFTGRAKWSVFRTASDSVTYTF
jgi:hypothetical protein